MMISSKGGPDGQPAMWESTIRGDLMNTLTTMRIVAWSGWRLVILAAAMLMVTALPQEVAAQSANANLRGKAPPNAEVTAKNADTGFTRRIKAGDDGSYVLVGLPPGTYQVDAGPGTQQNVTLGVATTATLDFEGATQAAAAPEEIVVTAERLHEVRTSEVGGSMFFGLVSTAVQRNATANSMVIRRVSHSTHLGRLTLNCTSEDCSLPGLRSIAVADMTLP